MSKQREALEMALQALEEISAHYPADWEFDICIEAIKFAREALAEPTRKSLTDEQIDALDLPPNGCTMRELVRAIERAHGIDGGHDCWR